MNAPNTGNAGNPNPDSGAAPANEPNPAVPGQAQTPPAGVNPQEPNAGVPLDRQGQPPAPGASGDDKTVPLAALQEEREKRQALQSELEQVRQQVSQIQQTNGGTTYGAPQAAPQAPQSTYEQQRAQIDELWEKDPREAVKAEINQSLSYYDTVNAQIEAQANQLAGKYNDFNHYRTTAMNYIRTLPYDQRAQNGIVELAYMVARGQNVDTLLQTREQELMDKFKTGQLAGSLHQPAGAGSLPVTSTGEVSLTPDQINAANAMGLSHADYASQIKAGS
jgi:tellurite resistance protein